MATDNLKANISAGIAGGFKGLSDVFNKLMDYELYKKTKRDLLADEEAQAIAKYNREQFVSGKDLSPDVRNELGIGEDQRVNKEELKLRQPQYVLNPKTGEYDLVSTIRSKINFPKGSETEEQKLERIRKEAQARAEGSGMKGQRGLQNEFELRKEFINRPEVKEYQTIKTQVSSMDSLLGSALNGDEKSKLALDQGLITMFNKLTDPNSVVRESEYERTPANLSLMNRVSGSFKKLKEGGAGLTNEDRKTLVKGAKVIFNARGKVFSDVQKEYERLASDYNFDPKKVTGTLGSFSPYLDDSSIPAPGMNNKGVSDMSDDELLKAMQGL